MTIKFPYAYPVGIYAENIPKGDRATATVLTGKAVRMGEKGGAVKSSQRSLLAKNGDRD